MSDIASFFENCTELTRQLVERESVTPNDKGCQQLLAERLENIGFTIEWLNFADDNGEVTNLWARRNTASPCFVFAGHTDVVPVGDENQWKTPPFSLIEKDGYLYGRGVADMKCSLAAFICSLEAFVHTHPNHAGSIALLITSDEEGPATCGTKKVIQVLQERNEHFDYCLVGEPSSSTQLGDVIKNGRRGSLGAKLTVIGTQGHIAYPHLADNPIHYCGKIIDNLVNIQWDNGNDFFPATSFQISNIQAGTGATNVIPRTGEITFNFRFSTELSPQSIQQRVTQELDSLGVQYNLDWTLFGLPFLTEPGTLIHACQSAITTVLNIETELSTSGGTSDGRFIAPTGAEVVELGPINKSIHQINEFVPSDTPAKLAELYFCVLKNIFL